MRKLDVVLPSYKRPEKLFKCLKSINAARRGTACMEIDVHVYFSLEADLMNARRDWQGSKWLHLHMLQGEFKASTFWNDHLEKMDADALCYLTDDVEISELSFLMLWNNLVERNFDGVAGFRIRNNTDGQPCKAAFGMIGNKYANRFPRRQVFCPDYWCFYMDQELEEYATALGLFVFVEAATLRHAHPVFTGQPADETHKHHRRNSTLDVAVYKARRAKNLLWGRSYDLIDGEMKSGDDVVVDVKREPGKAKLNTTQGSFMVAIETITTKYKSGRQDITIEVGTPLGAVSELRKP